MTAASSLITCIIPPSIGLVVYAYCTDTSVGKMLAAGYMPGILMTIGLMLLVAFLAKKRNYPPSRDRHASFQEIIHGIGAALWALGLPVILIVGLRCGIFSAAEGGAIVAVYATNPTVFLLMVTVLFLIIGMFMDGTTAMIIMVPIFGPIAVNLGIDMVQFGVVLVVN